MGGLCNRQEVVQFFPTLLPMRLTAKRGGTLRISRSDLPRLGRMTVEILTDVSVEK
jgi:hypothetical protein